MTRPAWGRIPSFFAALPEATLVIIDSDTAHNSSVVQSAGCLLSRSSIGSALVSFGPLRTRPQFSGVSYIKIFSCPYKNLYWRTRLEMTGAGGETNCQVAAPRNDPPLVLLGYKNINQLTRTILSSSSLLLLRWYCNYFTCVSFCTHKNT